MALPPKILSIPMSDPGQVADPEAKQILREIQQSLITLSARIVALESKPKTGGGMATATMLEDVRMIGSRLLKYSRSLIVEDGQVTVGPTMQPSGTLDLPTAGAATVAAAGGSGTTVSVAEVPTGWNGGGA